MKRITGESSANSDVVPPWMRIEYVINVWSHLNKVISSSVFCKISQMYHGRCLSACSKQSDRIWCFTDLNKSASLEHCNSDYNDILANFA